MQTLCVQLTAWACSCSCTMHTHPALSKQPQLTVPCDLDGWILMLLVEVAPWAIIQSDTTIHTDYSQRLQPCGLSDFRLAGTQCCCCCSQSACTQTLVCVETDSGHSFDSQGPSGATTGRHSAMQAQRGQEGCRACGVPPRSLKKG